MAITEPSGTKVDFLVGQTDDPRRPLPPVAPWKKPCAEARAAHTGPGSPPRAARSSCSMRTARTCCGSAPLSDLPEALLAVRFDGLPRGSTQRLRAVRRPMTGQVLNRHSTSATDEQLGATGAAFARDSRNCVRDVGPFRSSTPDGAVLGTLAICHSHPTSHANRPDETEAIRLGVTHLAVAGHRAFPASASPRTRSEEKWRGHLRAFLRRHPAHQRPAPFRRRERRRPRDCSARSWTTIVGHDLNDFPATAAAARPARRGDPLGDVPARRTRRQGMQRSTARRHAALHFFARAGKLPTRPAFLRGARHHRATAWPRRSLRRTEQLSSLVDRDHGHRLRRGRRRAAACWTPTPSTSTSPACPPWRRSAATASPPNGSRRTTASGSPPG